MHGFDLWVGYEHEGAPPPPCIFRSGEAGCDFSQGQCQAGEALTLVTWRWSADAGTREMPGHHLHGRHWVLREGVQGWDVKASRRSDLGMWRSLCETNRGVCGSVTSLAHVSPV